MRNHLEILSEIDTILVKNNLTKERQELKNEIEASSTGGELCIRSASKLLRLQQDNKRISETIGSLIKELISYCHLNGLYPKAN